MGGGEGVVVGRILTFTKGNPLGVKYYWRLGRNFIRRHSEVILKPMFTNLCGGNINSNILKYFYRFGNEILRVLVNAPRCISNTILHKVLGVVTLHEDVKKKSRWRCRRGWYGHALQFEKPIFQSSCLQACGKCLVINWTIEKWKWVIHFKRITCVLDLLIGL